MILVAPILIYYAESQLLCQSVEGCSPFSLLSGSVYMVLWCSVWSSWLWVSCRVVSMHLLVFFHMQSSSLTSTICWRCFLFSNMYFWRFRMVFLGMHTNAWVFNLTPLINVYFVCKCHAVFITVTPKYSVKSEMVIPPLVLLLIRIALVVLGYCFSNMKLMSFQSL